MSQSNVNELFKRREQVETASKGKELFMVLLMFVLGFFIFPLGLALGFLNYEANRRRSIAAFIGVVAVFLFVAIYLFINWDALMYEWRMRGVF